MMIVAFEALFKKKRKKKNIVALDMGKSWVNLSDSVDLSKSYILKAQTFPLINYPSHTLFLAFDDVTFGS